MLKTITVIAAALSAISLPLWADCSGPAGKEGAMVYNKDHQIMQFCDGTDWRAMGGSTTVTSAKQCSITAATYDGNDMGSVGAADAICAAYFESGWTFGTATKIIKYRPGGPPSAGYVWTSDDTTNCSSWSSTSGNGKALWSSSATGTWASGSGDRPCTDTLPIACCNF